MAIPWQFLRFAQVGVIGFLADWCVLTLALWLDTGFYAGRVVSYLAAATVTWVLNRIWTFAGGEGSALRQWGKFLSANAIGGAINYGVSALLATKFPQFIGTYPVVAVAAGSISGLAVNFSLSKRFVFRS